MSKLKIIGNGGGIGTFTIISPNSDTDATIELPHSGGTLVTNSQDLIPSQDEIYDLGSSTKAFKDLNISATTIFLGTQPIRATPTGIRFPELSIGSGLNRIRLRASPFGKLKQISTDSGGVELPEVDIPNLLGEMEDVYNAIPTDGQTIRYSRPVGQIETVTIPSQASPTGKHITVDNFNQTVTTRPTGTYSNITGISSGTGTVGTFDITVAMQNTSDGLQSGALVAPAYNLDGNQGGLYNQNTPPYVGGVAGQGDFQPNTPTNTLTEDTTYYHPRYPIWTNDGTFNTSFTVIDHKLDVANHGSNIITGFARIYPSQYTTSGSGGGATLNIALLMYDDAGFNNYQVGFDSNLVENGGNGFSDWTTGFSPTSDNYKFHVWVSTDPSWHPDAEGNNTTNTSGLNRLPYDDPNYTPSYLLSGTGFAVGDTITLTGGTSALTGAFGAITGQHDITIRIESGAIYSDPSHVSDVTIVSEGSGHSVGDIITIADSSLGATGVSDFEMQVATIDNRVSGTYTGVTGTSSGTGTVGTFDIVVDSTGDVVSATPISGGTDNVIGDVITISDSNLGNGQAPDFTMNVASLSTQLLWRYSDDLISVFSDFTDVDTVTTPPTDTQVLTWNETNNEWGAGNNGFPLTVANTTELLALTGMVVGQEAFVTDLNRSYTYTGSAPNDNWRHAVSGWYATDDIMTNHPLSEITGINSTYSLSSTGSSITITAAADDPDQKPISWGSDFSGTPFVTHSQTDNVFAFTQTTSSDPTANYIPISINVIFTAYDDSLDPVFFTTTISAFRISTGPGWPNGFLNTTFGGGDMTYGRSVSISSDASTAIISNAGRNIVWVFDKDQNGVYQADTTIDGNLPHFPDYADRLHPHEVGGGNGSSTYEAFTGDLRSGIYGGDGQERFSYGPRTVAISGDGLTAAVACVGETPDADRYEPTGTELLPYVEIHVRNPTSKTWTIGGKCEPTAFSSTGAPAAWTGGSGGVIVPGAGMTIALSENGTTLVVGYRLEGPHIIPHNLYADGTRTDGTNSTPDNNWYNWGSVYIYERDSNNNNWSLDTKLHGTDIVGSFGASVDISGEISGGVDTRKIIASTPNGGNGGYVQVFEKTGNGGTAWELKADILPPVIDQKINNRFGFNSISISKDGTKIAVGDPGQSVTNVIESSAPYYSPDTTSVTNSGGKILSTNNFTGSQHTYPAGVVYTYEAPAWTLQTNGIIENFIGVSGDGFGDSVDLSTNGDTLSIGATYEHNGFYFPGQQVGSKYINEYTAKRVFYGWYRFSHAGTAQPASQNELNAWNYTEATEAINCTVNSGTYIGFVTPADGKVDAFDLSVSFTSKNTWDNDMISIVIAFNTDANGKEHTISLIRSGGHIGYNYAIVYNYAQPDVSVIYNGVNSINDTAFVWGSTVATTGEGQFVRNRIVRSGDTFTVTTSQLLHPNSHTGTNSQLDPSTTHTFSLGSYSFGDLFSAANGGARWGFSCQSQDLSSWVNVELADAINPEEIPDAGSVHIFERDLSTSVWEKSKRFYPSVTSYGANKQDDVHFGRASLSDDSTTFVSGLKLDRDGQNYFGTPDVGHAEVFVKDVS